MAEESGIYLVLEDYVGCQDFVDVARLKGWEKYKSYPGDGKLNSFEEVWTTANKSNAIHYIDDPVTLTRHLWVRGKQVDEVLFQLRGLPCYEADELLRAAVEAEGHDDMVRSLFRVAVAFPKYDRDAYRIFSAYLAHPDAMLRKASVQAIGYRMWPEARGLLEDLVLTEPVKELREFAQVVLDETKPE